MGLIYEPRGRAREYSPLALNLYMGCTHRCEYCYAPSCLQKTQEKYFKMPEPRKEVLLKLTNELKKGAPKKQVLLSFIGDPYCETQDENNLTRFVLEQFCEYGVPTAILTKGGKRCLKDIDLYKQFGNGLQVGATLTFYDAKKSAKWEPGAASPKERLATLQKLHNEGVRTFASFEPVIEPSESLRLIKESLEFIDGYKIGKINHYKGIDKTIDWTSFLKSAIEILRDNKKIFYIKHDLQVAAKSVKLSKKEAVSDYHHVKAINTKKNHKILFN